MALSSHADSSVLTAIILATNESQDLPACLASLAPLQASLLVIDGGSSDATVDIAHNAGARVEKRPFDNFTNQRRYAFSLVQTPWVLQVDADERPTPQLCREIRELLSNNDGSSLRDAYKIPFQVFFMGRRMRFSGLRHQRVLRLVKKEAARFTEGKSVHESLAIAPERIGALQHPMEHRPYRDLAEYLNKCELYTDLAAHDFIASGRTLSWRYSLVPYWEFLRCYFLYLGFLDGLPGFFWSLLSCYHRLVRYGKIRTLTANPQQ